MSTLKQNRVLVTVVAILAVTLFAGAMHGHLSQRWGAPADVAQYAQLLDEVPTRIGEWQMESSDELEDDVQNILRCAGSLKRRYVNVETGDAVTVALLLGPAGPIAVHTPEICYSSRDFNIVGDKRPVKLSTGDVPAELWASTFRSKTFAHDYLRVYYGWSTGDGWAASRAARFEFSGQPWLYKIQVAAAAASEEPSESDACRQFLEAFVPTIQEKLASTRG